ncbi:MAG: hypothetical protein ABIJ59_17370 [Pseudomonadota bacterium]
MNRFWKNKKITAYVALKHHTRFIIPILNDLNALGAKVHYLVAQAERSQEITAIETGIDYSHIFDYLSEADNEEIQANYHTMRKSFGEAMLKDTALSLQVPTVTDKTLYASAQEYVGFKNYFKKVKPDLCIALHEVNRWGKIFAYHSKRTNVPCITLQEGLMSSAGSELDFTTTGHVQYSTLCLVWGEVSKKILCGYEAPKDRIISAGNTHLTHEVIRLKEENRRELLRKEYQCTDMAVLLLFSAVLPPMDEIIHIFESFPKTDPKKLFIKFHPATTRAQIDGWTDRIPNKDNKNIDYIHSQQNTYDLIAMSDVCVLTEGSTTGLEALAIGKPLVMLKFVTPVRYKSTDDAQKASISMTPEAFSAALINQTDFYDLMDKPAVKTYLENELHEPEKSIENIISIMKLCISGSQDSKPKALKSKISPKLEWTMVIPVCNDPHCLLSQLEALAVCSGEAAYEVILIREKNIPSDIQTILDSLEGNISILTRNQDDRLSDLMNRAAIESRGQHLVFMNQGLTPTSAWLDELKNGFATHGTQKIFGARVINRFKNIVHAGIIVNPNNEAMSAYAHLDENFPPALTERPFPMVDHFLCMNRSLFFKTGGFHTKTGKYKFLDFCLRTRDILQDPDAVIYLPKLRLLQPGNNLVPHKDEDSIFFHSRWHGELWENEDLFYKKDGVSCLQLEAARMTRAMETASLK